jgi:hypothetical protein
MNAKYYTHFISKESGATSYEEYRGVVELRGRTERLTHEHEIAQALAESFDLEEDDIRVLQWQRLH